MADRLTKIYTRSGDAGLTGLANGARRVDSIEWGVVDGSLDGTSGSIDLDELASWN